ncbi:MAG: acyl-CoA dehydrogenase family protein [Planctomycetota bacterium]
MLSIEDACKRIAERADENDRLAQWPAADLRDLAEAGATRWAVPIADGGDGLDPIALHERYEHIAAASLATSLIIRQHDLAVALLAASGNDKLREEQLPLVSTGESWCTIGISQLTTSRQFGEASVTAEPEGTGYRLDGVIPWVTGAAECDVVIIGATLADGQQLLAAARSAQLEIPEPPPIAALAATRTTNAHIRGLHIDPEDVLLGPTEGVLRKWNRDVPIGQAFLALGLARSAIRVMELDAGDEVRAHISTAEQSLNDLRDRVLWYCRQPSPDTDDGTQLRAQTIALAQDLTHAAVAVHKGTALINHHPAQRLAREALFLLVWSCPGDVRQCTLDRLIGGAA